MSTSPAKATSEATTVAAPRPPPAHSVYALDSGGYDLSRDTHTVLCDLRDALKSDTPPVTDVILFTPGRRDTDLPASLFEQLEHQRPASSHALYVTVSWPSLKVAPPTNDTPTPENGHARFLRLLNDVRATYIAGANNKPDAGVIDILKTKCERYMDDVERLVKYGKKGDERFSSDLREHLVTVVQAFNEQGSRCVTDSRSGLTDICPHIDGGDARHGMLTSLRVDDLQRVSLTQQEPLPLDIPTTSPPTPKPEIDSQDKRKSEASVTSTSTTTTITKDMGSHPALERHWAVLCDVIATVISRALERRAAVVGQRGVHNLLCDLMRHSRSDTRFHLAGHAHGAHAALSATLGASLPRRVHSVYLVQGSCDALSVTKNHGYRPLAQGWRPVAGPVVCVASPAALLHTHHTLDDAGCLASHGWLGVRNHRMVTVHDIGDGETATDPAKVRYRGGTFYTLKMAPSELNLENTGITDAMLCRNAKLAGLMWEAATVRLEKTAYETVDMASLPRKYWKSYRARTRRQLNAPSLKCSINCMC